LACRKCIFVEKIKLTRDGTIHNLTGLEGKQNPALDPDVRLPAVFGFLGRAKFAAIQTFSKLLNDGHSIAPGFIGRQA
jgi:hypothetical protein